MIETLYLCITSDYDFISYYDLDITDENILCSVSDNSPYVLLADTSMIEFNKRLEIVKYSFW